MKLNRIIKITATLKCLSGLHIGGGDTEMHIGGIDNQVIKHPLTLQPYIPGSSLKGKMRSLLEWRSGAVQESPLTYNDYINSNKNQNVIKILQLFGCSGSQTLTQEAIDLLGPARLAFWDCPLSNDYVKLILDNNMMFTEAKSENTINRFSGTAQHPRQMERVHAGATFDFQLTLKQLEGDGNLLETVFVAMKLLELDSLGGSGSRGYGKIKFENVCVNGEPSPEFDQIDPFKS